MKKWLLLRGLGRDKRHWGEFVIRFKQVFSDDSVEALDTCGNGEFADAKSPLKIEHYTEQCRAQLGDVNGKVHLVALSLGGMIALDWAVRYPNEVASMTLINTSAGNLTPRSKRLNFKTAYRLVLAVIGFRRHLAVEKAILQATSNTSGNYTTLALWTRLRSSQSTSTLNIIRQLVAAARFKVMPLAHGKIHVLILTSHCDRIVNNCASTDLSRFLQCPMVVHSSAGHDLPLDDGVWVIEQVRRRFLFL